MRASAPGSRWRPIRDLDRGLLLAALAVALLSCQPRTPTPVLPEQSPPRLLENLGGLQHPITTRSPLAQRYFDQGLTLVFGFNHEAAIRSFEEAIRLDPDCGACYWGIALALGPNINAPMGPEAARRARREIERAETLVAAHGTARERAYVAALATRYAPRTASPAEPDADAAAAERAALDRAYADAMRELHRADPADVDAATLFAESLMDLSPWSYWTSTGEPREFTEEILTTLEGVLADTPEHVGANHYYIHAVEEYYPERGEAAADRLGPIAPDAGHLVHMPSHIYWRVGRYQEATEINLRAAESDERFFAWCRPGVFYRAAYYPHNLHFLWAAAAAEGRRELSLMTARRLAATTQPGVAEIPILQEFVAIPLFTMARFGLWDSILGEPRPSDDLFYVTGVWHYARGLAHARLGEPDAALEEMQALRASRADPRAEALPLAGGTASASALLRIAEAQLEAEIATAQGDLDSARSSLEQATALHDALPYMEPPPWYAPPRQNLGALLIEMGRADEAENVYLEDLRQYPKNGWSLLGLAQSLRAQGEDDRARWAEEGFQNAWARSDVELTRSHL